MTSRNFGQFGPLSPPSPSRFFIIRVLILPSQNPWPHLPEIVKSLMDDPLADKITTIAYFKYKVYVTQVLLPFVF